MAGLIRRSDIDEVRSRTNLADVVGDYVTLKSAGVGSMKGLCPFHDERSPSFHVRPQVGFYHCFGCGEGGDVYTFLQKMDHVTFSEAVERLAGRLGYELHYEDGAKAADQGNRSRLLAANAAAEQFFREQLGTAAAEPARQFLGDRGFDSHAAERFSVGFAPNSYDAMGEHLRGLGFTPEELLASGLQGQGDRKPYDRFRGRLVWPIKDVTGQTLGFGARKLLESDNGPKYLNTPETPVYSKSKVLYGLDLAKRDIARGKQVVVVEGYTDVMACQLAGVSVAVATCGTAFGGDHIKVLRRLLMDDDRLRGEVVFTFDGDAAGQRAALKAFDDEQRFVAQTFVAVEPHGLDPCDLRQQHGDAAIRALVDHRVPLFEFAIRSTLASYDLESAEGRVNALREAAPIVAKIKDPALRPEYTRRLAGWLGMDPASVSRAVGGGARSGPPPRRPDARDPMLAVQREALKCALQEPALVSAWYESVEPEAYPDPTLRAVHEAIAAAGGPRPEVMGLGWVDAVLAACPDDDVRGRVRGLAVEPLPVSQEADARYATSVIARLLEMDAARRIGELRGRLQRLEEGTPEQAAAFADLMALEAYRRDLRDQREG